MDFPRSEQPDIEIIQAVDDVNASQEFLIIIFERIENFFKPLEDYAEVPTTKAVKDIVVKIMVKLLEIFGIMTKEIKHKRASELVPDCMFPIVDRGSEMSRKNFFKKSIRRMVIEDALSRLGRLTREAVEIMRAAGTQEERRSWLLVLLL